MSGLGTPRKRRKKVHDEEERRLRDHYFDQWKPQFLKTKRMFENERKIRMEYFSKTKKSRSMIQKHFSEHVDEVEDDTSSSVSEGGESVHVKFLKKLKSFLDEPLEWEKDQKKEPLHYRRLQTFRLKRAGRHFCFMYNNPAEVLLDDTQNGNLDTYNFDSMKISRFKLFSNGCEITGLRNYFQIVGCITKSRNFNLTDVRANTYVHNTKLSVLPTTLAFVETGDPQMYYVALGLTTGGVVLYDSRRFDKPCASFWMPNRFGCGISDILGYDSSTLITAKGFDGLWNCRFKENKLHQLLAPGVGYVSRISRDRLSPRLAASVSSRGGSDGFVDDFVFENPLDGDAKEMIRVPFPRRSGAGKRKLLPVVKCSEAEKNMHPVALYDTKRGDPLPPRDRCSEAESDQGEGKVLSDDDEVKVLPNVQNNIRGKSKFPMQPEYEPVKLLSQVAGNIVKVYSAYDFTLLQNLESHNDKITCVKAMSNHYGHYFGEMSKSKFVLYSML